MHTLSMRSELTGKVYKAYVLTQISKRIFDYGDYSAEA